MKIALIFGEYLLPRPLDFPTLWTNKRGVSGSDLGVARVCQEWAKMGHDVSLFTVHAGEKPDVWEGIKLYHIADKKMIDISFDAIVSWCLPDEFRGLPTEPVRLCSQQLNGFSYCKPGFDDFVDIWTSPSNGHYKYHANRTPNPDKWVIVPDGCDPDIYTTGKKIPGSIVYTSSPDRGAHWLLQEWQNIKKRVPEANLRVFYHLAWGETENYEKGYQEVALDVMEVGQRIRYLRHAASKLKGMDVEWVGSVSRQRLVDELDKATVFAYPASVVSPFCEGFSCSTMEACAAGCVPVISDIDALGELYGGVVPMIGAPGPHNIAEFTDLVVRGLRDEEWREETTKKCKELAKQYTWRLAAEKYIDVIKNHSKYTAKTHAVPTISNGHNPKIEMVEAKKKAPVISICMPTMRVGGLDIVFESLKHQTFKDFELVISDSIYKYRKNLVAQKAKEYDFAVKHVEPTKNTFPVAHFCNAENTALVNASSKLILMITDYTYLPPDCVEKHIKFHADYPDDNRGLLGAHQYRLLPPPCSDFPTYKNEDTDKYVADVDSSKLNNVMWSIFEKDFCQDPETMPLDSMGNADTKLFMPFKHNADQNLVNGKNESIKLEAALKINGWDEELDGTTPYQDSVFSDMLVKKLGFIWSVDGGNKAYIINPRFSFPWSKRLRTIESNLAIWERKKVNNFPDMINTWDLRDTRNSIMGRKYNGKA